MRIADFSPISPKLVIFLISMTMLANSNTVRLPVFSWLATENCMCFRRWLNQKKPRVLSSENEKFVSARDIKGVSLAVNKAINAEINRLSRRLDFLATTGSTTPFIGLFGTVWGIMTSFSAIGFQGSASIGGVAPGIAEALIATAGGLLAAIPAVIFYNYLSDKIRAFTSDMDDFSNDFLYLLEKNFSKDVSPVQITDLDLI